MKHIQFGYGLIAGNEASFTMEPPANSDAAMPRLTPSSVSIPQVVRGRSSYTKLKDSGDSERYNAAVSAYYDTVWGLYGKDATERLKFTMKSRHGFFERLVYFWENHFAIMTRNKFSYAANVGGYENEAIRPHVFGRFRDMLRTAVTHPLMLVTLDQHTSFGPNSPAGLIVGRGINENLGRELLELHTLGVTGGYDQRDVEQLSLLLTGLSADFDAGISVFRASRSEPGSCTVLGKQYGSLISSADDIGQVITDLAAHPSTARHVCRKLAASFISDEPPAPLVAAMVDAFQRSDGHLPTVYDVMVNGAEAYPAMSKVKTPLDYVVSGLRALGAPESPFDKISIVRPNRPSMMAAPEDAGSALPDLTIGALNSLGHQLWGAPGPDGWPDRNTDWLHADGLAKRLAWAGDAALLAPGSAQEFLDGALGGLAANRTRMIVSQAKSALEGVTLALMSPEFNRR